MNKLDRILVIIVTYNGKHWMDRCLGSLLESTSPLDIFVVDNLSTDGTPEYIAENYPQVDLIKSKENLGFAAGNNLGLRKAIDENYEYVFLLNQDAWLSSSKVIEGLVSISKKNLEHGILSPIHLNGDGTKLDWNFAKYISSPKDEGRNLYTDLLVANEIKDIYSISFVNAAAWLITRKCLQQVGVFDSDIFPHYGEDNNYVERVTMHKMKVGVVPSVYIHHDREERLGAQNLSPFTLKNEILEFKSSFLKVLNFDADKMNINIDRHNTLAKRFFLKLNFKEFSRQRLLYKEKLSLAKLFIKKLQNY